jgi:hypothetical protein
MNMNSSMIMKTELNFDSPVLKPLDKPLTDRMIIGGNFREKKQNKRSNKNVTSKVVVPPLKIGDYNKKRNMSITKIPNRNLDTHDIPTQREDLYEIQNEFKQITKLKRK